MNTFRLSLIILTLISLISLPCQVLSAHPVSSDLKHYSDYYNTGNRKYMNGDISGAIEMYEKALLYAPLKSIAVATNNLAAIYMKRGTALAKTDPTAALNDFRQAAYLLVYGWSDYTKASANMQNNQKKALENLAIAYVTCKIQGGVPSTHLQMAKELEAEGKLREAFVEYKQADILGPQSQKIQDKLSYLTRQLRKNPPPIEEVNNFEIDMYRYTERLSRRLALRWFPPLIEVEGQAKTMVQFTITPDGNFIDISIKESSGNPEIDKSTLEALEESAPFYPVPISIQEKMQAANKSPNLRILFPFRYNGIDKRVN